MSCVVADASVVIKWLLRSSQREADTDKATALMQHIATGKQLVLQPAHWLAEVGAVLARESPATAAEDVVMLDRLELPIADDPLILRSAVELAIELRQHMFDTLYHAIALLTPETTLVTADDRYLRAARRKSRIVHLATWNLGP